MGYLEQINSESESALVGVRNEGKDGEEGWGWCLMGTQFQFRKVKTSGDG